MGFSSGMMPPQQPKWKFYPMRILLIAFAITCISACTAVGFPGVYRIDVEQGNIVTQELADQLQPGMSRRQVRFILGTPMVEDSLYKTILNASCFVASLSDGKAMELAKKMN